MGGMGARTKSGSSGGGSVHKETMSSSSPRGSKLKKFFRRHSKSDDLNRTDSWSEQPVSSPKQSNSKRSLFTSWIPKSTKSSKPERRVSSFPSLRDPSGSTEPAHNHLSLERPPTNKRQELFQWQDEMEAQELLAASQQKRRLKERDGFCRRVDSYDGQVLHVEGKAVYELGNYLGGGVAGVVYEGHRLQPLDEYPVRSGHYDATSQRPDNMVVDMSSIGDNREDSLTVESFLCGGNSKPVENVMTMNHHFHARDPSLLTLDSYSAVPAISSTPPRMTPPRTGQQAEQADVALETMQSHDAVVIIDKVDAPSRSKHLAKACLNAEFPSDASFTTGGFMEETVAIKILNPVGFRTLPMAVTQTAVVARPGAPLEPDVLLGDVPMEERHVWWLVNPNSRNLRTLQRYNSSAKGGPKTVQVDRGCPEKGLRISLVACYKDQGVLKELPLTKCLEIWGHVPFGASDLEFDDIMNAIDRVNQGLPPPADPAQRVGTETTGVTVSTAYSGSASLGTTGDMPHPTPMNAKRTGVYRAAYSERKTVFCLELNAYIAIPSVPSKYLKWLRQRRAATKEIRNMMLIGRHRNVVHLFEVLELIQENKSTMFLILELVRGGELFDLISSNAAKLSKTDKIPEGFNESETVMRKFFRELASGIRYCHENGIAHRDLKPENLLVHHSRNGDCVLKIADFGLSAVFRANETASDQETVVESLISFTAASSPPRRQETLSEVNMSPSSSPIKEQMDKLLSAGGNALAFLTCGAVDDLINNCNPRLGDDNGAPSPLKRMTSVVGSPHYVAPEIISQSDSRRSSKNKTEEPPSSLPKGYDGTKADVWSAGVILYAMLFRSLPFGEDLLRCPRFQSYRKWYNGVKKAGNNRRSHLMAALNPNITDADESNVLGPHWFFPSSSSREARDLIVYMLNPDPDVRPTIQLVLQHPWLLKQAS